jgi:hypothetical protein
MAGPSRIDPIAAGAELGLFMPLRASVGPRKGAFVLHMD